MWIWKSTSWSLGLLSIKRRYSAPWPHTFFHSLAENPEDGRTAGINTFLELLSVARITKQYSPGKRQSDITHD